VAAANGRQVRSTAIATCATDDTPSSSSTLLTDEAERPGQPVRRSVDRRVVRQIEQDLAIELDGLDHRRPALR
jgi:hypothetical protein